MLGFYSSMVLTNHKSWSPMPSACVYCTCVSIEHIIYHRSDFECVVKWLPMVLYKPDYNSNDCELPSRQTTPSTLVKGTRCGLRWGCMWGGLLIEHRICMINQAAKWLYSQSDPPGTFVLATAALVSRLTWHKNPTYSIHVPCTHFASASIVNTLILRLHYMYSHVVIDDRYLPVLHMPKFNDSKAAFH